MIEITYSLVSVPCVNHLCTVLVDRISHSYLNLLVFLPLLWLTIYIKIIYEESAIMLNKGGESTNAVNALPKEMIEKLVGLLLSYWESARKGANPVVELRNDVQLRKEFAKCGVPLAIGEVQVGSTFFGS